MTIYAFTDGASRGNPGESGIGIILKDEHGKNLKIIYGYIGQATNNVAEYKALLACLNMALATPLKQGDQLIVHSDSELMVRQFNGEYKVKDQTLKRYFQQALRLIEKATFGFTIKQIAREENKEADRLANLGIDSRRKIKI